MVAEYQGSYLVIPTRVLSVNFIFDTTFAYIPTSVKRIAGQSFEFDWTHTNSAGHDTFIRTDSIKINWTFHPFWEF